MSDERRFAVNDKVRKVDGYEFDSTVQAVFNKRDGQVRLVCEDDRGLLHIFNQDNMEKVPEPVDASVLISESLRLVEHSLSAMHPPSSADARAGAVTTLLTVKTLLTRLQKENNV